MDLRRTARPRHQAKPGVSSFSSVQRDSAASYTKSSKDIFRAKKNVPCRALCHCVAGCPRLVSGRPADQANESNHATIFLKQQSEIHKQARLGVAITAARRHFKSLTCCEATTTHSCRHRRVLSSTAECSSGARRAPRRTSRRAPSSRGGTPRRDRVSPSRCCRTTGSLRRCPTRSVPRPS